MRLIVFLVFAFALTAQNLKIEQIMQTPFMWGDRVSSYNLSPNGDFLYYKIQGKNLVKVDLNSNAKNELTEINSVPYNWINSSSFLMKNKNNLYEFNLDDKGEINKNYQLISSSSDKQVLFTSDKSTQVFLKGYELYVKKAEKIFTMTLENKDLYYNLSDISSDGNNIILTSSETLENRSRKLYFPDYLPTFTDPGEQRRSVRKNSIIHVSLDLQKQKIVYEQEEGGYISNAKFVDNNHFVFIDHPISRKSISYYYYDISQTETNLIYKSTSKKWVVGSYSTIEVSPDQSKVLFIALNNKYERLFTFDFKSKRRELLSKFNAEITFASWYSDDEIVYLTNLDNPTERIFQTINITSQNIRTLKHPKGFIKDIVSSKNGKKLAYQFSTIGVPDDLYVYDIKNQSIEKISNTVPEAFTTYNFPKTEILKTKSKNNKFDIYANFYSNDKSKKPLIVFVHGAGILQNVRNGWTRAYYREYMFHQFLLQQGYNVLDVDYRGSKGYSHDFSTDVHSHLGEKELEDIVTFIELLDKQGRIDKDKIGIYGGSYGGFMASYAMAFQPDLFKAGAALRSVFKWENYYYTNEWYTRARLDHLEGHEDWYKRSSPLYHVDKIKNPLLILHGMKDDNVPFQDAVQMVQEMITKQKTFDLMIYPNEKHSFSDPLSWIDEYKRIFNYFELYLK